MQANKYSLIQVKAVAVKRQMNHFEVAQYGSYIFPLSLICTMAPVKLNIYPANTSPKPPLLGEPSSPCPLTPNQSSQMDQARME